MKNAMQNRNVFRLMNHWRIFGHFPLRKHLNSPTSKPKQYSQKIAVSSVLCGFQNYVHCALWKEHFHLFINHAVHMSFSKRGFLHFPNAAIHKNASQMELILYWLINRFVTIYKICRVYSMMSSFFTSFHHSIV